jgi:hypothetical protein
MPFGVDYGETERRLAIAISEAGLGGGGGGGTTLPTLSRLPINISNSGDNTIVAAVAAQKVKVLGLLVVASGDVNLTIKSGAGTSLSGAIPLAAKGNGFVLPVSLVGYHLLETAAGAALVFNLSGAIAVTGAIVYLQEA